MFDFALSEAGKKAKYEAREFAAGIDKKYLIDMDNNVIQWPKEFLQEAARRNLLGPMCKPENGGRGLSWVDYQAILEEIGGLGYICSCTYGVGAGLVPYALEAHGTQYLQDRYIKPVLKGEKFSAECLTEPRGGSDFFGAAATAEDKGEYFLLNGDKRFIVGGEGADYFFVYARTNLDPQAPPHECITAFMVERDFGGVETAYIYDLMGCNGGGAARVTFRDVKVPKENVIGEVHQAYDVFNTMMVPERLGTAMMTIGTASAALDVATRYTMQRKQFGKVISRYQGVSFQIAEAAMLLDVARASCNLTARLCDQAQPLDFVRRQISQTKKFTTEACQKVAQLSMQVMGGIGYTKIYPVERYVRELGLASIWTGTSEVMSLIIASEWYKEQKLKIKNRQGERDWEDDANNIDALDEKVYE
ncbi:MAG: acyl-CoA dehydrogenase family protein [Clostridiales Family XIII bacterium]|jgi:alkylation response protein AidB-like acyl-CoA dehydrogenase|nr:acyl-CoA dehydrogenase family protein [Clostridiales Family XIII bacterium]